MHGARKLLHSGLIRNIFMEVSARSDREIIDSTATVEQIALAGYDVYQYGGFRGPHREVHWSSAANNNATHLVQSIMHEVTKKRHAQLNLWWKLTTPPAAEERNVRL
jgi:hypothetical protein